MGHSSPIKNITYSPAEGAVNIPVEGSYPLPSFRSTVPNTTRPFLARSLTSFANRTSKATEIESKKNVKIDLYSGKKNAATNKFRTGDSHACCQAFDSGAVTTDVND